MHEQRVLPERRRQARDVAIEHRRQIGVDQRRIAATDQLDQRRDAVADRNLREADRLGEIGQRRLMRGEAIAVHQDDRDRAEPGSMGRLQPVPCGIAVERSDHAPVRRDPLVNLDDVREQRCRACQVARENVGALLMSDHQRIAEAARDRQDGRLALALEQRIGRDGRPDPQFDRHLRAPGQPADRLDRGIGVAFGVFGQQFSGNDFAARRAGDDIGEGAAAIDPELPCRHPSISHFRRNGSSREREIGRHATSPRGIFRRNRASRAPGRARKPSCSGSPVRSTGKRRGRVPPSDRTRRRACRCGSAR